MQIQFNVSNNPVSTKLYSKLPVLSLGTTSGHIKQITVSNLFPTKQPSWKLYQTISSTEKLGSAEQLLETFVLLFRLP